jgi:hypothetical protein
MSLTPDCINEKVFISFLCQNVLDVRTDEGGSDNFFVMLFDLSFNVMLYNLIS